MNFFSKIAMCLALCVITSFAFGQGVTTASFSGSVADNQGDPLPGAVINVVHEPTGTRYETVSRANGSWRILNVRVGGPYTATATMTGFKTQKVDNIFVRIGEDRVIDFKLQLDSVEETLVVVAESNPIINPSRTGAATSVGEEAIQKLPSVTRELEDFLRTNPFFAVQAPNGSTQRSITVAGRSNRYNNILIDGAVNNDLFGLSASGTPGGQAEVPAISLEALQEIQLLVAPYDIRQGGFTGGGVNAITKSGSNSFNGSAFFSTRTEDWIGDGPNDSPFGLFEDDQLGFSVGGPIVKDKAFFFVSYENREKQQGQGWAVRPDGDESGSGVNFGRFDEATRFRNALINNYGYDPGGFEETLRPIESDNFFARFDFNINDKNRLTVRHNYVDATNLINSSGSFTYRLPNNSYVFPNETNSTVIQLNSTFGDFYNEFRVGFQTIKDRRQFVGDPFPWIEIENLPGGGEFEAGSERFSTQNALDQDILEITNDLTFFRGNHTITIGTHNELFSFDNLFIRENFGAYQFNSIDDFENGIVEQYDISVSATSDPQQSAKFDVQQLGFYIGDQWAINPDFQLTMGLRLDIPLLPDTPTRNPQSESIARFLDNPSENPNAQTATGLRTDEIADGNLLWSPRVGFNWDVNGDSKQQLRGGVGIFSGRTPYVWISNQFSNTGIEFTRLRARFRGDGPRLPFNPDPFNQPLLDELTEFGVTPATNEIDLMDPDFEYPQLLRWNLAYDRDLEFWGLIGSAELIWSQTQNDIVYQDLNRVPQRDANGNVLRQFDGRTLYEQQDPSLTNVIFLTNADDGEQFNLNVKVERPFQDGWYTMLSYTHGKSDSINDGNSSQAYSNWRFLPTRDPNFPEETTANFEVEHRINAIVSYNVDWGAGWDTNFALYYNAQSGQPYSTVFNGDVNGDGETGNDLFYVPASADEVIIVNGTWEDLNAYIEADEGLRNARGSIVERNASREPWRRQLDFSAAVGLKVRNYKFALTIDILNFLNIFDDEAGKAEYVNFGNIQVGRFLGLDDETGKPTYLLFNTVFSPENRFTLDNLRSRWRGKLGLRFTF